MTEQSVFNAFALAEGRVETSQPPVSSAFSSALTHDWHPTSHLESDEGLFEALDRSVFPRLEGFHNCCYSSITRAVRG
jgi:hypothetical protein